MSLPRRRSELLHPKHWPIWVGIGIFRLLIHLPLAAQRAIGRAIGRLSFLFLQERRRITRVNLGLCFPELSQDELTLLEKRHFESVGIGLFETCMAWWAPPGKLPPFEIRGAEHLEKAREGGRGVILFTAHFTTLEICGRLFSNTMTMGGLYRDPDNPVVAWQMHRGRIDKMSAAVAMHDLRGLIRALKQGHTMWYAPDQGRKTKLSSLLPFFGVPAVTNTATSRLAQMTGAAVVPYFGRRLEDGSYLLEISPALEGFPTENAEQDAIRTNRLIEESIRKAPEQYFWVHRRFKRRGKQHPNVYKK
jgi:KDO2-lipid IV(A) lauroyltransferase